MCGIAGVINWSQNTPVIKDQLKKLQNGISHRGPDGEGTFIFDNIGLCHKRLSIIDINEGSQPMISSSQKIVIVYNGEIYNYLELRRELLNKGYKFKTKSDTEVIIQAYVEWGEKCVEYFNGMWAFAILDKRKNPRIFCSRDRMGIKPFYYRKDDQRLIFCSEIKAFDGVYDFKLKLNNGVAWDHLVYGPKNFGDTIVREITQLEPGSNMLISDGKVSINRYFKIEDSFDNQNRTFDIHEVDSLLINSVKLRLRSDVPVATINSGGLDSSIISSIASKSIDNLHTYSVHPIRPTNHKGHLPGDEKKFADKLAYFIKSKHKTITYDPETFLGYLEKTVNSNDGELYHSNSIPLNYMFNKISMDGIKVVLGGEGADEVFSGYYSNRIMRLSRILGDNLTQKITFWKYPHKKYLRREFKSFRRSIPFLRSSYFSPNHASRILNKSFTMSSERKEILYIMKYMSSENALTYYEQKCYLSGLLQRADRVSMANQIELRVPFLDHRLVLLLNRIKPNSKSGILRVSEKKILKRIALGKVPQSIIKRAKYGFGSPLIFHKEFLVNNLKKNKFFKREYHTIDQLWLLNTLLLNSVEVEYAN